MNKDMIPICCRCSTCDIPFSSCNSGSAGMFTCNLTGSMIMSSSTCSLGSLICVGGAGGGASCCGVSRAGSGTMPEFRSL